MQSCVRQKLVRLKKIGTMNSVADLNTKNLRGARRKYLLWFVWIIRESEEDLNTCYNNNP